MHVIQSNSRTSTHWKLNVDTGTVQSAAEMGSESKASGSNSQVYIYDSGVETNLIENLFNQVLIIDDELVSGASWHRR